MESSILIWSEDVGFIRINEGTGDNLLREDIDEGYVDYIMVDGLEYDGYELFESYDAVEGGQVLLTEMYQDMFETVSDVIQYLIDGCWIPDVKYTILYAV